MADRFPADGFSIIPAIDIQDGEVVQLVGGDPDLATAYGPPDEIARRWVSAGARRLHVVDLDGAFAGERRNADAIEEVIDVVDVPVQLGGGIRSAADARRVLDGGVDAVILGTAALEDPSLVEELAADYGNRVVVSLDASEGEVVVEGWTAGTGIEPTEAAVRYAELGAGAILFTDVDVEGQLAGVRTDAVREMAETVSIPIIASGGVTDLQDLRNLRDAGAAASVVGTALYEGRLSLEDAIVAFSGHKR